MVFSDIIINMKLEIHYEKDFQIQLYISLCQSVVNKFFAQNRHILLPYRTEDYWFLPDYNLFADPQFKEELENIRLNSYFDFYNEYLYNEVSKVFGEYVSEKEISKDISLLNKHKNDIFKFIENIFTNTNQVDTIYVIPSKIGTVGSFGKSQTANGKYILYCSYRIGHIEHLPTTILAAFIQISCNFNETIFQDFVERQKLIEFFQSYTKLGAIFGKPKSLTTLQIMDGDKSQYIIDSAKYLAKMGYPAQSCFSYDKDNIYFNGKAILGMQEKEFQVLKLLIDRKNTIVSFDDIAQAYWKIDWREKFSLFGITKVIEKIRKSLIANGIKFEVISTIRKRGYSLYD